MHPLFKPNMSDHNKKMVFIGDNTIIGKYSRIQIYPQPSQKMPKIIIGNNCYIEQRISLLAGADIRIDDGVLMASDILITSENHSMDPESNMYYMDQKLTCAAVHIKEGCWIGEKVCILPGVTIGKKSIIGAGSIVNKSIPDYSIAVGNPARIIKHYNFEMHQWERIEE